MHKSDVPVFEARDNQAMAKSKTSFELSVEEVCA